ncbi:DUF4127 family protein [Acholeplasma granularum]|uniref:DUF4127 family protein n=1 Tax=Acholeplasma granularum TaxID=264635 RepID=UPI00046E68C2|nr:DUF4127 family protein [Acholeplasma granularum]
MKKIAILPLDERPCNYQFNQLLVEGMPYEIIAPDLSILGLKKQKGDLDKISTWLKNVAKDVDGMVIAVDTLVYGGIVPSRLHHDDVETLLQRLNVLKMIKEEYPHIKIYAYNLIMRNPKYSSSDEEPDYYEYMGREIHLYGVYNHKKSLGILTEEESKTLERIEKTIDHTNLKDYLDRRDKNIEVNIAFLELIKEGIVEFGIVPQDDSSPYGLTANDQVRVRKAIKDLNIELTCYMYPGADEVTNTLLARLINQYENKKPLIYPYYASITGGMQIPLYEDRILNETVKYQVLAAGGILVSSLKEAEIALLINVSSNDMTEANNQHEASLAYDANRNLIEYVEFANYALSIGKKVIIADVAYANGGDLNLLKLLRQKGILTKISAYAGWNTSSNTLGTCIPQGMFDLIYPNRKENINFLGLRFVEDFGYCSVVRKNVAKSLKEPNNYFLIDGQRGKVVEQIKKELNNFIKNELNGEYTFEITDIYSPWNRMFETGLKVIAHENK